MNKRKPTQKKIGKYLRQSIGCGVACLLYGPLSDGITLSGTLLFQEGTLSSVEDTNLQIQRYSPSNSEDALDFKDQWLLETQINHITPEALMQISGSEEDIWVYVQYFTDLNGDGIYEWEIGEDLLPIWDSFNLSQELVSVTQSSEEIVPISQLILSAEELFYHGIAKELTRSQWGKSYLQGVPYNQSGSVVYCFTLADVPLHLGETTQQHQSYYVTIDHSGYKNPHILGAYTYTDLDFRESYFKAVDYCVRAGLMYGSTSELFYPEGNMSRAMALQSLMNLLPVEERPLIDLSKEYFSDISSTDWYATAFYWAKEASLLSEEEARPNEQITQVELLQLLYRLALSQGETPLYEQFPFFIDGAFSDDELLALSWGVTEQILHPNDEGQLFPDLALSRSETALILYQFANRETE